MTEIHIAKHRNGPTGMVKVFFDEPRASFRSLNQQQFSGAPEPHNAPPLPTNELKPKSAFANQGNNPPPPPM